MVFTRTKKIVMFLLLFMILSPVSASAQFELLEGPCENADPRPAICDEVTDENPVTGGDGLLSQVTVILATVTAVISVIVIIIAGMTMVLSSGNPEKIQSSRDAIIYALVALVVASLARVIVIFVTSRTSQ